ncbi:hypothetical protein LBMAG46_18910 [Planctomycetia bacterium]|nr:hypothetical protein LBMAG46_18910 [Planctomycetia bacterium]
MPGFHEDIHEWCRGWLGKKPGRVIMITQVYSRGLEICSVFPGKQMKQEFAPGMESRER